MHISAAGKICRVTRLYCTNLQMSHAVLCNPKVLSQVHQTKHVAPWGSRFEASLYLPIKNNYCVHDKHAV